MRSDGGKKSGRKWPESSDPPTTPRKSTWHALRFRFLGIIKAHPFRRTVSLWSRLRHLGSRRLAGLALLQMHRMLAAAVQDRIALHLVAFPRRGLELSGMSERFAPAM